MRQERYRDRQHSTYRHSDNSGRGASRRARVSQKIGRLARGSMYLTQIRDRAG